MAFLGAALAVSDLAPPAPDSTNANPAVIRTTHRTTTPAMPHRRRRCGATAIGPTPGAQPSPIGTMAPCGP